MGCGTMKPFQASEQRRINFDEKGRDKTTNQPQATHAKRKRRTARPKAGRQAEEER